MRNLTLKSWLIACGVLVLTASPWPLATAQSTEPAPFFQKKEEGWFWRKEDPLPKPPKPPASQPVVVAEPPKPKPPEQQPFTAAWLRKNLPLLQEKSFDNPSRENILAYFYAQRVLLDKSQTWAETSQKVVLTEPALDEVSRTSFSTFGRLATASAQGAARDAVIKRLTTLGGIWMFYDSTCSYCLSMAEVVQLAGLNHGFVTKYISVDNRPLPGINKWVKDQGQAKMLELKITPTVVFVVPPNGYFIVSQGAMSLTDLLDRILIAAENQEMLTATELKSIYPERSGILTTQDVADGATDDPVVLVNNLRKKIIGSTYAIPTTPAKAK